MVLRHIEFRLLRDPITYSYPLPKRETRVTFLEETRDVPAMRVFFIMEGTSPALLWVEEVDDALPLGFDDWLD